MISPHLFGQLCRWLAAAAAVLLLPVLPRWILLLCLFLFISVQVVDTFCRATLPSSWLSVSRMHVYAVRHANQATDLPARSRAVLCLQQSIVAIPRCPKCINFLCVIAVSLYCCRRPFILFSFIDLSVGRPRARYPSLFFFVCVCGYLVFPATHLKRSPLSDHCGAAVVSDDWRSLRSSLCVRAQYSESQILGRSSINLFVVRFVSPLSLSQAAVSHVRNAPETAAASGAKANPGAAWCVACLGWRFYLVWTQ